ncbi:MAG: hypothetical protein IPN18_11420 [Ignavibacteriales bacterium]|nr:hypothetical protein [Ignavibacteriales bacterium]
MAFPQFIQMALHLSGFNGSNPRANGVMSAARMLDFQPERPALLLMIQKQTFVVSLNDPPIWGELVELM